MLRLYFEDDLQKRLLENKISRLAEYFPAIVLTGARQVGKSTLLRHLRAGAKHITFDPLLMWKCRGSTYTFGFGN